MFERVCEREREIELVGSVCVCLRECVTEIECLGIVHVCV